MSSQHGRLPGGQHPAICRVSLCRAVGFGAPAGARAPQAAAGRLPRRRTCQLVPSQDTPFPNPCLCPLSPRPVQGTACLGEGFPTSDAISRRREMAVAGWRAGASGRERRGLGAPPPHEFWGDSYSITPGLHAVCAATLRLQAQELTLRTHAPHVTHTSASQVKICI